MLFIGNNIMEFLIVAFIFSVQSCGTKSFLILSPDFYVPQNLLRRFDRIASHGIVCSVCCVWCVRGLLVRILAWPEGEWQVPVAVALCCGFGMDEVPGNGDGNGDRNRVSNVHRSRWFALPFACTWPLFYPCPYPFAAPPTLFRSVFV